MVTLLAPVVDKKLIARWQGHQDGGQLIMNTYTEVFGGDDAEYERGQLAKLTPSRGSKIATALPVTPHPTMPIRSCPLRSNKGGFSGWLRRFLAPDRRTTNWH